ncbi:MAG: hypothetical protein D6711_14580 [Chloroflexi bacterium]|nr:MAG: hypothetical protein D6711_14580 [Chloroflexota bacterium]
MASNVVIRYDVMMFNELVQKSAIAVPDDAIILLEKAISLYKGSFLKGIEIAWAEDRRKELQEEYGEALAALAKLKEQRSQKQEALGLYLRALSHLPHREDLASHVMRLYREHNMHTDALLIYQRLRQELQQRLGVQPAPQLQNLMQQIQKEM